MTSVTVNEDAAWRAAVAEAAAWIALLHGPGRTPAVERGLKRWLGEHPLHSKAFEVATETWLESRASVKREARASLILPAVRPAARPRFAPWGLAAAACAVAIVAGAMWFARHPDIATGIGERRVLALDDGTQVFLNTATRLAVDFSAHERRIHLKSGEALFEVAKQSGRPFVVTAGNRTITALGTAFVVRFDPGRIAVTLTEGKVVVAEADSHTKANNKEEHVALTPGERLTYTGSVPAPKIDWPDVGKLTAWQHGKIHIDNLTLATAVEEINRYNRVQLSVEGSEAASLRLSGIFAVGDAKNFANAVARTHGLRVTEDGANLVISGTPRPLREPQQDGGLQSIVVR